MSEPPDRQGGAAPDYRWQQFFHRAREAIFLLNRQGRILFVNRAWQELIGLSADEARRELVCRRRHGARQDYLRAVENALAPTPEVQRGEAVQIRRYLAGCRGSSPWYDVAFFPWHSAKGPFRILGKITPATAEAQPPAPPLPEGLLVLRARCRQEYSLAALESEHPAMQRVADQVRLAARNCVPVLLLGEAGSGKAWIARTIHQQGLTCEGTFLALDCARLPPYALERVLFAERAPAGEGRPRMVHLREPQHLPRELQDRLVDLLYGGTVDASAGHTRIVRVSAGLSSPPEVEVRQGRLLEELACALGTVTIVVPPLRERPGDLPRLIERLLGRLGGEQALRRVSSEAMEVLRRHPWPENLRELYRVVSEAGVRARHKQIEVADLPYYLRSDAAPPEHPLPLEELLEQVERRLIQLALKRARNHKGKAAKMLSIWRARLIRRMAKLGIEGEGAQTPDEPEA